MPDLRVVVVGASFAGCFSAAALAGPGRAVVVLERDRLPEDPRPRPGVPQGWQQHILLARGLREAEALLPGLTERLRRRGALTINTGALPWRSEWGWLPASGRVEILSLRRPVLEHEVRAHTARLPGVCFRDGAEVRGLRRTAAGWAVLLADGDEIAADLLVDAGGRSSRLPNWLAASGLRTPDVVEVDARVGYATRAYAGRRGGLEGIVIPMTADHPLGGLALPVEGDRWLIAVVGCGDLRPERDPAAFEAALDALPDPAIADLARSLEPAGDVHVARQTGNRRVRWDRFGDLPAGLLVVGDALCSFNPVYGQGITVAAMQAAVLRSQVNEIGGDRPLRRLQRKLTAATTLPWTAVVGADTRFPTCTSRPTTVQRLGDLWVRRLSRAAIAGDRAAGEALATSFHLVAPPSALLRPRVVLAGLLGRRIGAGPPPPPMLPVRTPASSPPAGTGVDHAGTGGAGVALQNLRRTAET